MKLAVHCSETDPCQRMTRSLEALRQAPELSDGIRDFDPPSILPAHRDVEVFLLPYYDDLYIAVPDTRTLLLSLDAGLLEEIIDRRLDGAELDEPLRGLLDAIGPVDFLVTRRFGPQAMGQDVFPHFLAGGGRAEAEETSTMFWYMELAGPEEAAQFLEPLKEFPDEETFNGDAARCSLRDRRHRYSGQSNTGGPHGDRYAAHRSKPYRNAQPRAADRQPGCDADRQPGGDADGRAGTAAANAPRCAQGLPGLVAVPGGGPEWPASR